MFRIKGMVSPVFTPMTKNGFLNLEIIPRYAEYLASKGMKGVYVAGTSGEGLSLSIAERKLLTEAWVKVMPESGLQVIAMVGAAGLIDTQELAKHAESIGVSAVATLPPLFDKPQTVEDLVDYCYEVASAAPKTPLLYYHIPFKTGVEVPMDEFLMKGAKKIPTLSGMKFTSKDILDEGLRCLRLDSEKFAIYSGFDDKLYEALTMGYNCAINCGFNLLPEEANEVFVCVEESTKATGETQKDWLRKAEKQQTKINTILDIIFSFKLNNLSGRQLGVLYNVEANGDIIISGHQLRRKVPPALLIPSYLKLEPIMQLSNAYIYIFCCVSFFSAYLRTL